jgi:hypothetical protein
MIRVKIDNSTFIYPEGYLGHLSKWQDWCSEHNITYKKAGSSRKHLEPNEWCVQRYCRANGIWSHTFVCFHESNKDVASLFKLQWH